MINKIGHAKCKMRPARPLDAHRRVSAAHLRVRACAHLSVCMCLCPFCHPLSLRHRYLINSGRIVCVCVRARVRVCVCVCVWLCVCVLFAVARQLGTAISMILAANLCMLACMTM